MPLKIVINKCYGGFGLSVEAMVKLVQRGCKALEVSGVGEWIKSDKWEPLEKPTGFEKHPSFSSIVKFGDKVYNLGRDDKVRTDPDVVAVVEEMGQQADGWAAKLKVVDVPDGVQWEIDEYDGIESVREISQSWG